MGSDTREMQLIETFVEIADTMVGGYDVVDLLYRLVSRCSDIFDAADAGILLRTEGHPLEVVASTTERSQLISLLQLTADEGPCVDAYRTGEPVTVSDIDGIRARWPDFAARAGALGYRWMYAVPLRLRDEVIGSLNLFGDGTESLSPEDARAVRGLADIATIGILHEQAFREADVARRQLQRALDSRVVIEQAKGVLAHAHQIDMDEAFQRLRDRARSSRRRLADLARDVVENAADRTRELGDL
ncbi:GAF and ANTAR domain-containing protein [Microbacterium sp. KSW4-11]|uniref:GAF and ANTAR domain-containing protein n=1 Tax=Microbacterium gawkjiense TaxID=3067309 RepID=A0ABU3GAZ2_9MICO|nr:GAF and ANTAR domain-containing protein [Microbacterium sp. KSW4-11]MDT3316984.1 GAF and ANTAR domain-containing protein [Microbacterium sp. KSW4-11]